MKNALLLSSAAAATLVVVGIGKLAGASGELPEELAVRQEVPVEPSTERGAAPLRSEVRLAVPDTAPDPPPTPVAVEALTALGHVLHWQSLTPVGGLSVGIADGGEPRELARCDADGRFTLSDCEPDTALVAFGEVDGQSWCTVRAGLAGRVDEAGEATLLVAPCGPCEVVVRDHTGAPVAGARVALELPSGPWSRDPGLRSRTERADLSARTDARGACTLAAVPYLAGAALVAGAPRCADARATVPAIAPAGEAPRQVTLVLAPLAGARIEGHVVHQDGSPAAFAEVAQGGATVQADGFGWFTLDVPPDDEQAPLTAHLDGFVDARADSVDAADGSVELRLGPPDASLEGEVCDAGGALPQRASLFLYRDPEAAGPPLASQALDHLGRFRFEGLEPGRYAVWLVLAGRPAQAVRIAAETGAGALTVRAPESAAAAAIGADVSGRVVDASGSALADAQVRCGPDDRERGASARTDSDGRFQLERCGAPWTLLEVTGTDAEGRAVAATLALGPLDTRDGVVVRAAAR